MRPDSAFPAPPPARMAAQEETTEELIQSIKDEVMREYHAGVAYWHVGRNVGNKLIRLKRRVGHGQWLSTLERIGMSQSAANRKMRQAKAEVKLVTVTDLETAITSSLENVSAENKEPLADIIGAVMSEQKDVCHHHWKQGIKHAVRGCLDCKSVASKHQALPFEPMPEPEELPSPVSQPAEEPAAPVEAGRNGQARKPREREPGDPEPYEMRIIRLDRYFRKELALLAKIKAVPAQTVNAAYRSLETLLASYRELAEAPTKPPPAIIEKLCDDCGGGVQLVPTPRGKIVALNQHPGKGRFSIIDGLAVVQKFGGQYRPHHLTCVAKQNRNGDV